MWFLRPYLVYVIFSYSVLSIIVFFLLTPHTIQLMNLTSNQSEFLQVKGLNAVILISFENL